MLYNKGKRIMTTYVKPEISLFVEEGTAAPNMTCYKLPDFLKLLKIKLLKNS